MRISDWSSDVCSSDLHGAAGQSARQAGRWLIASGRVDIKAGKPARDRPPPARSEAIQRHRGADASRQAVHPSRRAMSAYRPMPQDIPPLWLHPKRREGDARADSIDSSVAQTGDAGRSEEHTSELQSLMRI